MRHNKKFNHLGRTASHRSAMLSNMACSLIKHKRITTTVTNPFIAYCLVYKDNINSVLGFISDNN